MLIKKERNDVLFEVLNQLKQRNVVTHTDPGGTVRTFTELMSDQIGQLYEQIEVNYLMSYVSTATGEYLNLIGAMLDCIRLPGESDSNYRTRITQQVYVVAGGNLTSIRLSVLNIQGVQNVVFKPYTYGTGSFSAYVVTENPNTPSSVLYEVEQAINEKKSFGIHAEVHAPEKVELDLMIRLFFKGGTSDSQRAHIKQEVAAKIREYVANIEMGGAFIVNEVIGLAMDTSHQVKDMSISGMNANGVPRFAGNVQAHWDERFVINEINIG